MQRRGNLKTLNTNNIQDSDDVFNKWNKFRTQYHNFFVYATSNSHDNYLYVPNDIFNRINSLSYKGTDTGGHRASAYMIYIMSKLFLVAKQYMNIREIKKACGYRHDAKEIDYIIKKDGILVQAELIRACTQINYLGIPPRKFESREVVYTSDRSGNFFKIPIFALLTCMFRPEIGASGIYIYSIISKYSQLNRGYKEMAGSTLTELTYYKSTDTIDAYISKLIKCGLLNKISGKSKSLETGKKYAMTNGMQGYLMNSYLPNNKITSMKPCANLIELSKEDRQLIQIKNIINKKIKSLQQNGVAIATLLTIVRGISGKEKVENIDTIEQATQLLKMLDETETFI